MSGMNPVVQRALEMARGGRLEAGIDALRRHVRTSPKDAAAHQMLSMLLLESGRHDEAIYAMERVCELAPGHPAALISLTQAYLSAGRYHEAVEAGRKATRIIPNVAMAWGILSLALTRAADLRGAVEAGRRAVALDPRAFEGYSNLGLAEMMLGRTEDAVASFARAHAAAPMNVGAHDALLMALNASDRPPEEVLAVHKRYGELHRATGGVADRGARTEPDPERRIRVGLLSGDFRTHSVAYFLLALLEHRDRAGMEFIALHSFPKADAMGERLRGLFDRWVDIAHQTDPEIDATIRREKIDVLIELGGHSVGNRLAALVNKPAPVIISAIGYPHTTGLGAVDYRLVDSLTDPAGAEAFATEKLIRLDPCFLCYTPPPDSPEVAPAPCLASAGGGVAPVTFGSFNTSQKLSLRTLRLWARVMQAVPGSRLVLKSLNYEDPQAREEAAARFVSAAGGAGGGVEWAARVECLPPGKGTRDHLECYARLDVSLDPMPYAGTTTTCESLWMGVPVVTMGGATHASRVGVSLLTAAGCEGWIARDEEEYVAIAARLAADKAGLSRIRAGLREKVRASTLCDGRAYAERFYAAIRACWRERCEEN